MRTCETQFFNLFFHTQIEIILYVFNMNFFLIYVKISCVLYIISILLSVTVQDVESTGQNVETNGNLVNLTAIS